MGRVESVIVFPSRHAKLCLSYSDIFQSRIPTVGPAESTGEFCTSNCKWLSSRWQKLTAFCDHKGFECASGQPKYRTRRGWALSKSVQPGFPAAFIFKATTKHQLV